MAQPFDQVMWEFTKDGGDTVNNVDQTLNLYVTYESRDTLNSFSLFLIVKTILKLNREHSVKLEIEIK